MARFILHARQGKASSDEQALIRQTKHLEIIDEVSEKIFLVEAPGAVAHELATVLEGWTIAQEMIHTSPKLKPVELL
ncbi:MAG: hypothetical protein H7839_00685 [Magnetococcus sp. YQC-5]